jgi:hypothetical protein
VLRKGLYREGGFEVGHHFNAFSLSGIGGGLKGL